MGWRKTRNIENMPAKLKFGMHLCGTRMGATPWASKTRTAGGLSKLRYGFHALYCVSTLLSNTNVLAMELHVLGEIL